MVSFYILDTKHYIKLHVGLNTCILNKPHTVI